MAAEKNSFLLYCDIINTVSHLTSEQRGDLFMHILEYVNDRDPKTDDPIIKVAFEPIKHQLKRDLKKWEKTRSEHAKSGKIGGIKSGESRRSKNPRSKTKQNEANEAVSVSVSVSDSVNVNERESTPTADLDGLYTDAFQELSNRRTLFESICIKAGKGEKLAIKSLEKYHLYLIERNLYPMSIRSIQAGFTKWLMNEYEPKAKPENKPMTIPLKKLA